MRLLVCAALFASAMVAPAAHGATLSVSERYVFQDFGYVVYTDLVFTAAAGEANDVTVASTSRRDNVGWVELGAPIFLAPSAEYGDSRWGSHDEGCVIGARGNATIFGDRQPVTLAMCVRPHDPPDLNCQFNPMCMPSNFQGYGRIEVGTGDGDDVVRAQDGEPQHIDCGPGTDSVSADDVDVVTGCEIAL